MNNAFFKLFPIALLILIPSIAVYTKATPFQPQEISQNLNQPIPSEALEVALPQPAIITSKQGNLFTGTLVNFNAQEVTLAVSNNPTKAFPIAQIRQIDFQGGDVWIPGGRGERKLRGEDRTTKGQRTWQGVPINAFNLQPDKKTALLKLGAIVSQHDLRDLLDLSKTIVYVMDDINFDTSGQKMTIRATPVDRKNP